MSWKLVNKTYIGPDALGATEDTSYSLGYLFFEQAKEIVFCIGNTGSSVTDFRVTASGENSSIVDAVEFSKDSRNWVDEVSFSGINPNEISDTCRCRFTVPDDSYISSGTFLIRVDET